jgi:hypothetical protein
MDLFQVDEDPIKFLDSLPTQTQGIFSSNTPNLEAKIIESLTLEEYHEICAQFLVRPRVASISTAITLDLGVVICCPSENWLEDSVGIAWLPDAKWSCGSNPFGREVTENGWMRY